ncbi:MAG: HAD family phosphatase [Clostridiales bacterium]|nr:HAD family phosphatase [Clostridiales bacterium]
MDKNWFFSIVNDIDAIIFDLDGTLADSMWVWSEIDQDFFREHKIDFPESLNREIEGLGFTETAQFFVDHFPLKESVEEIKQLWNDMALEKYRTKVPLKPGAVDFLAELRRRKIKTGIATSNSQLLVDTFLTSRGIASQIDAVTTVCDVSRGKPAPDVYLVTAEKLNAAPGRCLVFEDIPMGICAGKNAGMRVCAVEDDYSAGQREEKRKLADYYIEDFREIVTLIPE